MKSCRTAQVTNENFTVLVLQLSKLITLCMISPTKQVYFKSEYLLVDLQRKYNVRTGNSAEKGYKEHLCLESKTVSQPHSTSPDNAVNFPT